MSLWMRFLALLAFVSASPLPAQFATESPAGISAGLAQLFEIRAFTANADLQVLEADGRESLRTQAKFAFLDKKMRMDIDVGQIQGQAVEPAVVAALKQAGLDRVSSLVRLDQKTIHLVFPGARSCVTMPMSKSDAEMADKGLKVARIPDGTETIGGRACTRNRVRVTNAAGANLLDATTWTAADSRNFPVQIAVRADGKTTFMRFTQVQLGRPDANLFEAPAKFSKYSSVEMLLFASIQKQGGTPATAEIVKPPPTPRPTRPVTPQPAPAAQSAQRGSAPGATRAPAR